MSCQIAKTEYWKIMIWLSDTKCCHLAIHYVLPKFLPGPNLHIRFMKNCIHTSLLGSLFICIWCKYSYLNDLFCISVILNGKLGKNMTHHNHNLTLITRKHHNKRNCAVGLFLHCRKKCANQPYTNYSVGNLSDRKLFSFGFNKYQLCL